MEIIFVALYLYPIWGLALFWWFCRSSGPTRDFRIRGLIALGIAGAAALIFTPAILGNEGFALFVPWWMRGFDPQHTHLFPWGGPVVFVVALTINLLTGSSTPKESPSAPRHTTAARSHQMLEGLSQPAAASADGDDASKQQVQ